MLDCTVIIPSNRTFDDAKNLYKSIFLQVLLPKQIIILLDRDLKIEELLDYQSSLMNLINWIFENNLNIKINDIGNLWINFWKDKTLNIKIVNNLTDKNFVSGQWASFVRNYWIKLVNTKYLLSVDDDNKFEKDFLKKMSDLAFSCPNSLIIPTELYKQTNNVRSMWYKDFNYLIGRQVSLLKAQSDFQKFKAKKCYKIAFASSNCLFWPSKIFKEILFDENIPFVYEDFIFTSKVSKKYSLFVWTNVFVNHIFRDKTRVQELYISNEFLAFQKWRNRVVFAKTFLKKYQFIIYLFTWLWIHTLYLILMIVIYLPKKSIKLTKSLLIWTWKWLVYKI